MLKCEIKWPNGWMPSLGLGPGWGYRINQDGHVAYTPTRTLTINYGTSNQKTALTQFTDLL